jgi:hypothetical protein
VARLQPTEADRIFRGPPLRPGVLRDHQPVRNDNRIRQRSAKAGGGDAGIYTLDDELALILGHRGMFSISWPAEVTGTVLDGSDLDIAFTQQVYCVQHADQGMAQPVNPPHNDGVALLGVLKATESTPSTWRRTMWASLMIGTAL